MKKLIIFLILILVIFGTLWYVFIPRKDVWLEDEIQSGGYWATTDIYGGWHGTKEKLNLYEMWKYKGHYKDYE